MPNNADPLGVDIFWTDDFPLRMRLAHGLENLQCAALRRLSSDEGCLEDIGDDPSYGNNLMAELNNEHNPGDLAAQGGRTQSELEKDPRLSNVRAKLVLSGSGSGGQELLVSVEGDTEIGPFELVAQVTNMSIKKLNAGLPASVLQAGSDIATTTGTDP